MVSVVEVVVVFVVVAEVSVGGGLSVVICCMVRTNSAAVGGQRAITCRHSEARKRAGNQATVDHGLCTRTRARW